MSERRPVNQRESDKPRGIGLSRLEEDGATGPNTVTEQPVEKSQLNQSVSSQTNQNQSPEDAQKERKEEEERKALARTEKFLNWKEGNEDRLVQAGLTYSGSYDSVKCECGIMYKGAELLDNPEIRKMCFIFAKCEYANVSLL